MLKDKFLATINKYHMLCPKDNVLVAISGGPDSVAMLYLLNYLAPELKLKLHIAHLNHMLRPKESNRDSQFVTDLARSLKIPITTKKINVSHFARSKKFSLEEGARILRYDFFLKTAKKIAAKKIAVAHTQDDQAETVLMRLIRGSGLLGLSAISPIRQIKDYLIIRPMISISRREIYSFLKKNRIDYCFDSSNQKSIFLRNKIRNHLLPYLKRNYKSSISLILSRAAENIALDYGYLSQKGEEAFKTMGKFKNDQVIIILKLLKEFHPALQKQICRLAIQKIKGGLEKIEEKHYNLFLDLIKYRHLRTIDLPSDILVVKKDDKITFSKMVRQTHHPSGSMNSPSLEPSRAKSRENHPERSRGKTRLKIPGKTNLPNFNLVISAKLLKSVNVSKIKHKKSPLVEYLDYGQLKKPIFIRFRQKGDKFQPLGMKGVKSLKKFFIDEKIPLKKRNTIPLVTDKKDIIWVAGQRISQKAKITPQTKHILKLTLLKNKLPK